MLYDFLIQLKLDKQFRFRYS